MSLSNVFRLALAALMAAPIATSAQAQDLAGAPRNDVQSGYSSRAYAEDLASPTGRGERRHREARECYAQVRYPATYAPPPTGPEYIWRQAPAPPGAPGPVWCLTVQPFPNQPVQVAPARLGWVRVLCADEQTPDRIARLQRRLHEEGLYRGEVDGRYDERTAGAVAAFQQERHIEHRGYLSYETLSALDAPRPPPVVIYRRKPTTFDRGYVAWPGESRYW